MTQEIFYYLGSGLFLGVSSLIWWYIRYSIIKQKEDKKMIQNEFAEIKQLFAGINKDIGFIFGEQKQQGGQLEKHNNRLLQNETRLTRIETRVDEHLKSA